MASAYIFLQSGRKKRTFKTRENLHGYDDQYLIERYRLDRNLIENVCELVRGDLERATKRNEAISVSSQVLTALRFYATGSFFNVLGDSQGMSRMTVSRIVDDVSCSISKYASDFIKFPTDNAEKIHVMQKYFQMSKFPNVLGCIDGTHVAIRSPSKDEHLYVNRKCFHSINVQGVCDSDLRFTNIVAKWPGSSHDSFIWTDSALSAKFESGEISEGWLLGDSAYPLRPWMMTPYLQPSTPSEHRYNARRMKARNSVERCFGVWKGRFRCLDKTGGPLLFNPSKACKVIVATAVLHNMCINHRIQLPECEVLPPQDNDDLCYNGTVHDGRRTRENLALGFI